MNVPPAITAKSGIRTKSHRRGDETQCPLSLGLSFFGPTLGTRLFDRFGAPWLSVWQRPKQLLTTDRGNCLADLYPKNVL